MDDNAKRFLAKAIVETFQAREDSFDGKSRYALSYRDAANSVCSDQQIAGIVGTMLMTGFEGDFVGWAENVLK